jgi:hypothetical protein
VTKEVTMKRMITVGFTVAALAVTPGTEAASLTPQKVAKIAKRVFRTEIRALEPVADTTVRHAETAGHAATAGRAATAGHADTAGHANTAARADTATHVDTVGHAATADRATTANHATTANTATTAATAETAEVAGTAESANPMAYALVSRDGRIYPQRSSGISQADVTTNAHSGLYCFFGPRPKGVQVTAISEPPHIPPVMSFGLGRHQNCPEGIEFYVRGSGPGGGAEQSAFFLSLVL